MIEDIIGLKAEIATQLEAAREFAESARIVHEEAQANLVRLQEFFDIIEDYRGGSGERRNVHRTYNAPGTGTKAELIEALVLDVLGNGPLKSDQILGAIVADGKEDLLPGETRSDRLARLSTYLTRMHRRANAPLAYNRDARTYGLREVKKELQANFGDDDIHELVVVRVVNEGDRVLAYGKRDNFHVIAPAGTDLKSGDVVTYNPFGVNCGRFVSYRKSK